MLASFIPCTKSGDSSMKLNSAIGNASSYINNQVLEMRTDYEKAIAVFALQMASPNCPRCVMLLSQLETSPNKIAEGILNGCHTDLHIQIVTYLIICVRLI